LAHHVRGPPSGESGWQTGIDRRVQVANDFVMLEEIPSVERATSILKLSFPRHKRIVVQADQRLTA